MDDEVKAKVAVIVTPIVIILIFLINKAESNRCDPIRERTRTAMNRLYSKNSIKQIVLKNGREALDSKLDSLTITDSDVLEEFRNLILDLKYIPLDRYSPKWEINMIITVDTGTIFTIGIKKSNDLDETDTGYKIYFNEECNGSYRDGSQELGHKVLELIRTK